MHYCNQWLHLIKIYMCNNLCVAIHVSSLKYYKLQTEPLEILIITKILWNVSSLDMKHVSENKIYPQRCLRHGVDTCCTTWLPCLSFIHSQVFKVRNIDTMLTIVCIIFAVSGYTMWQEQTPCISRHLWDQTMETNTQRTTRSQW